MTPTACSTQARILDLVRFFGARPHRQHRHDLPLGGGIALQLVGNEHARGSTPLSEELTEQAFGGLLVAPALDQNVENKAVCTGASSTRGARPDIDVLDGRAAQIQLICSILRLRFRATAKCEIIRQVWRLGWQELSWPSPWQGSVASTPMGQGSCRQRATMKLNPT